MWKCARIAMALCSGVGLFAASASRAATVSGSSTAAVVRAGTLVNIADLNFGALIPGATAGTATVTILGARSVTGGVTMAGGTVSAARFVGIDSTVPYTVNISAPSPSTVTLTRAGGGATMTVTNLVAENGPGAYTTPANVPFVVRVGGRLNVGANQMRGSYTGTFSVTVDYP